MRTAVFVALTVAAATAAAATRPPAVAGGFYTDDPVRLRAQVEEMLEPTPSRQGARALVVPHAGYAYSGAVAGKAFATLDGVAVRRVILLGPSHHRSFSGAALPARGITAFSTPLGDVPLDMEALASLRGAPDFKGPAAAHDPEHSLEVELPFLQVVAPKAEIVPILVGQVEDLEHARRIARTLMPLLGPTTVVVGSSDFTHHGARYGWTPFHEPDLPRQLLQLGRVTAGRLAAVDPEGFWYQVEVSGDTVCGARPMAVLIELLAHALDGKGDLLDLTTSGEVSGSWDLSVTYAGVAFFGAWTSWRDEVEPTLGEVSSTQGAQVVALARATLESYLSHDGSIAEWYATPHDDSVFRARAGAFVTLNHEGKKPADPGRLRACMGVIEARQPLEQAVVQAAVWAAQDPRFPRLEAGELDDLELEVSILSASHPVPGPEAITIGTHGIILSKGGHRALFLPQVATEQGWDLETTLDHLARKAGMPAEGWRRGATFEVFTAQVFAEER
jgi:AmmeMemoRadiSam system protein B/AmmeMemoRadiSam system protein A